MGEEFGNGQKNWRDWGVQIGSYRVMGMWSTTQEIEQPKNTYAWPMDMHKGVGIAWGYWWGCLEEGKGEKIGTSIFDKQ